MDTVEAGLFKFVIVSRTGILPVPEAVIVGQAFRNCLRTYVRGRPFVGAASRSARN